MPRKSPPSLAAAMAALDIEADDLRREHGGSRYVGDGASEEVTRHIAGGGSVERGAGKLLDYDRLGQKGLKTVSPGQHRGAGGGFAKAILDVAQHRTEHLTPVFTEKALAELTDPSGGYLLTAEIADSVLMLIRNRVAVMKMPITHVTPRSKQYVMPGLSGGASAAWLAENAAIPASAQTFQVAASMIPRPLGALVAISNRLLHDAVTDNPSSAGSAEDVIQKDVADLMR